MKFHTIITTKNFSADLIIAIFLLQKFGTQRFPEIDSAKIDTVDYMPDDKDPTLMEDDGFLGFYFKGTMFPRATGQSFSRAVVKKLQLSYDYTLENFIAIAEGRADKGIHTLIQNIIKQYESRPHKAFWAAKPILKSQYNKTIKAIEELPAAYTESYNNKKVVAYILKTKEKDLRVMTIESDHEAMPHFLHTHKDIMADIVCQKFTNGECVLSAHSAEEFDFSDVAAIVRIEEALKNSEPLDMYTVNDLRVGGVVSHIPAWSFDAGAPAMSSRPERREDRTKLTHEEIMTALFLGLDAENITDVAKNTLSKQDYFKEHLKPSEDELSKEQEKELEKKAAELEKNIWVVKEKDLKFIT